MIFYLQLLVDILQRREVMFFLKNFEEWIRSADMNIEISMEMHRHVAMHDCM